MYYISEFESNCVLSLKKKRLGDFKGVEGERYHVRKRRGLEEGHVSVPVYIFENGKLRRCPNRSWTLFNLFASMR
tara:strand:+ start:3743 stop:3967 length:225 start_codon:yes stop_codon:yes gene_type:complete